MKIVNPSFEIEHITENPLQVIEKISRVCYKSEDYITADSSKKFVQSIISRGHEAMLEHASITFKLICDRGVSHELVRHRIASYAQESTRYCNYSKDKFNNEITFIRPTYFKSRKSIETWKNACEASEFNYFELINNGEEPQIARSVLNNSLKTEIYSTMNFRALRNFLRLRTERSAHPSIKQLAIPMLLFLQKSIPIMFDDIKHDYEFENYIYNDLMRLNLWT